jgi:hypothetical protein
MSSVKSLAGGAADSHEHMPFGGVGMRGVLPAGAPAVRIDEAWWHDLQVTEEGCELRHRVVVKSGRRDPGPAL